jgi:hypothetical protein
MEMTKSEWQAFLIKGTRTTQLATVRKDSRPHVVPIGFVLDSDEARRGVRASQRGRGRAARPRQADERPRRARNRGPLAERPNPEYGDTPVQFFKCLAPTADGWGNGPLLRGHSASFLASAGW